MQTPLGAVRAGYKEQGAAGCWKDRLYTCSEECSALGEEGVQRGDGAMVLMGVWQGRVWWVMPQVHQARNWLDVGLMEALIHEGPWFPTLKCPPRCSLRVTSRLHPHSFPLPHEPLEGGWEVPRLHAPSSCGGGGRWWWL